MKKKKVLSDSGIKVRTYDLLARAVEEGAEYGWRRAYKHTEAPDPSFAINQIVQAVMNEIGGIFQFEDDFNS